MINALAIHMSKVLVKRDVITFEKYELCIYGLQMILTGLLQVIVLLVIALVFGYLTQMCVFLSCFCILRSYAGGWHASNVWRCTFYMGLMASGSIALTVFVPRTYEFINLLLISVGSFGILLNQEVFPNLRQLRKKNYEQVSRSLIVFMLLTLSLLGLSILGGLWTEFSSVGILAMGCETLTLIDYKDLLKWGENNESV